MQPLSKILYPLLFTETLERFSYWGLQSILVLYLLKAVNLPIDKTYLIFGTFTAFSFGLMLVGGIVADRLFGFYKTVVMGAFLACIGNLFLSFGSLHLMYYGLALIVLGTGLLVPNNANLLGAFYIKGQEKREPAFAIFYIGTNIGGLLGPLAYGAIVLYWGWHATFAVSFILLLIAVFFLYYLRGTLRPQNEIDSRNGYFVYGGFLIGLIILAFFIAFCLSHLSFTNLFIIPLVAIVLIYFGVRLFLSERKERLELASILFLIIICLLFFAFEFQVNSSLLVFADKYVNRKLLSNFTIPASDFAAFEPLFVILFAPVIAFVWKFLATKKIEFSTAKKFTVGFLLSAISFYILFYAGQHAATHATKISLVWIMLSFLLLGLGELFVMPIAIAAVTKIAPEKMRGTFMGFLYLALAFSGYLAGSIASLTGSKSQNTMDVYNFIGVYHNLSYCLFALTFVIIALQIAFRKTFNSF